MSKFIINSVMITKYYTAYEGDSYHTLSLNFAVDGNLYLIISGERTNIKLITTDMDYIEWLLFWAPSLLDMPKEKWWENKYNEFFSILEQINYDPYNTELKF